MNKVQQRLWLLLAVAFATCLTIAALSLIVTHPWEALPDIGGDGAKNNLTYLYHSMYGKGYWFTGMNYPYGEHIVYTDGQPLLSVFFASIGNVSAGTALTVCWWLLGLSYVLGMVYIYKTLLYFRVGPLAAVVFSGCIGMLTPQLSCVKDHYALGYTCIVPMLFYWSVLYHHTGRLRYCLYIFVMGAMAAFLHPYYAGMMLIWAAAYALGYFIFIKAPLAGKLRHAGIFLASIAAVAILVAVIMKLTDTAKDRPVSPFTPSESYTHIRQIFSSGYSPLWQALNLRPPFNASKGGEGFTYPGIVCIITVSLLFAAAVGRKLRRRTATGSASLSAGFSPVWLFIAFGVLAFSMGIPFIWHMQWLLQYISLFKQFRALGRFSWIFYYIITIYTVVVLYQYHLLLAAGGRRRLGYTMLAAAALLWGYEAGGYIAASRAVGREAVYHYEFTFQTKEQSWEAYLQEHHYNKSDFQAILALKYFNIGSEKLWVGDGSWLITLASRAALQLHLPIIDVMMSRSSWGDTKRQVKIVGGPYTDKPLLHDESSNKPFLLIHFREDSLDADQKYLLKAADYIGDFSFCHVYACYPGRLAANDKRYEDEAAALLPTLPYGDTCIRGSGSWYVNHYESGNFSGSLLTGVPAIKGADSIIAIIPVNPAAGSRLYELSAWFLLDDKDYASPDILVDMLNGAQQVIGRARLSTKESVDNYRMFFRGNVYFSVPGNCRYIKCKLLNDPNPSYLSMDELMLRPADALIITKTKNEKWIMVNNHLYHPVRQQ